MAAGVARMSEADCAPWAAAMQPACLATLAGGTDCIVWVRADASVSAGCVAVDEVMQRNLHLCLGETYSFRLVTMLVGDCFAGTGVPNSRAGSS